MAIIYDIVAKYTGPGLHCDNKRNDKRQKSACDALVLGSVIKGFTSTRSLTKVGRPAACLSFDDLLDDILGIDVLVSERCSAKGITHGVKDSIRTSIKAVEQTLCGLELIDFLPKSRARADN